MKDIKNALRKSKERRRYERRETNVRVRFQITYDVKTRVKFRIVGSNRRRHISRKYLGFGRDINVEGLSFVSRKKLEKSDMLLLEVYVPKVKVPVLMEAEVRWSKMLSGKEGGKNMFQTGVRLISVQGKSVSDSIYYDKKYKLMWSIVLEAVFGGFKRAMINKKRRKPSS